MKVYLSGPIEDNIESQQELMEHHLKLKEKGYDVIHATNILQEIIKDSDMEIKDLKKCIPWILKCDYLVTVPNWYKSEICKKEVNIARLLEIPVVLIHSIKPIK